MRIILWAAILIVLYRGVMAIALNEVPASSSDNGTVSMQFPVSLAEAYAMQFGRVYFDFSQSDAVQRQGQLRDFLPPSLLDTASQQFSSGPAQLQSEDIAGIDVHDSHSAVVTLLATINGEMMEFGVPVYAAGGGIVISGLPALLPAPLMAGLPQGQRGQSDLQAQSQLKQQLPDFFSAYANGAPADLGRYITAGASITGLSGEVTFRSIASLFVPSGGATRDITVSVNWQLAEAQGGFAATYDMTVVRQQGGKWYVNSIRASAQP